MSITEVAVTDRVDLDVLAVLYHKVHDADLHLLDHTDPSVEDRLRWTAEAPGFSAAVGYLDGDVVGAFLGCPLPSETLWWRDLGTVADPSIVEEWTGRTFALCEAFILPEARKYRLGVRMMLDLLDSRTEERVSLAVSETNVRVWRALQHKGYTHVGDLVPFPGWRSHRMLVGDLQP